MDRKHHGTSKYTRCIMGKWWCPSTLVSLFIIIYLYIYMYIYIYASCICIMIYLVSIFSKKGGFGSVGTSGTRHCTYPLDPSGKLTGCEVVNHHLVHEANGPRSIAMWTYRYSAGSSPSNSKVDERIPLFQHVFQHKKNPGGFRQFFQFFSHINMYLKNITSCFWFSTSLYIY